MLRQRGEKKVLFFGITDARSKLDWVLACVERVFQQKKKLLITVDTQRAADYLDIFLWKEPSFGFFPHVVSNVQSDVWVVITTQTGINPNEASALLNLRTAPIGAPLLESIILEEIYEYYQGPEPSPTVDEKKEYYSKQGWAVKIEHEERSQTR